MKKNKPSLYWLHSHILLSTGGTRFIYEALLQLSKSYQVTLIVERAAPEWKEKYAKLGVNVIEILPLSSTSMLYWLFFPVWFLIDLWCIRRTVASNDLVVSSMFPMNVIGSVVTKRHVFYCFEPFAFFYDSDLISSFSFVKQICLRALAMLYGWLDKWGTVESHQLLGINPSVGKNIKGVYGRSPDGYTYLGVDITFFSPKVRPLLRPAVSDVRIFHSTDYTTLKGTQYLLEALGKISDKKNIHLFISETMLNETVKLTYLERIKKLNISNQITFLGHVPYSDLPSLYKSCDIYVFCGSPEAKGATAASLSVLEASAMELPVVRSVGNDDEVINNKTGILVDPRRTNQLASAILRLAERPELRKKMGKMGRAHILKRYRWKHVAQVLARALETVYNHNYE